MVKNPPAKHETWIQFLGWEDPLKKEMAAHSNILVLVILGIEESCGLQSMGSQESWHDCRLKTQHSLNRCLNSGYYIKLHHLIT